MTSVSRLALSLFTTLLPAQQLPTDAECRAALARYRELALPEPPATAAFVLLHDPGLARANDPARPAFRLAARDDATPRYLCGTRIDTDRCVAVEADPSALPQDATTLASQTTLLDPFARDQDVAVGMQLWGRGAHDLARRLLRRGANGQSPADRVALLAADHWYSCIVESDEALPEIQRRLQAAVALLPPAMPAGDSHPLGRRPSWTRVLEQLERTNRAPTKTPDPMTALVLDLVHSRLPGGACRGDERDAHFDAVVAQGFAVVPALLAHLDDDRLTRSLTQGFNNFPSYVRPLGEVAGDALRQIAGGAIPTHGIVTPRVSRDAAEAWWQEARERKEDEFMVERFLATPVGPLRILAAKFPERLELAVLDLVARHPERVSPVVVDAIADGSMRKIKKIELLERVATQPSQRLHALRRLAAIDEPRFCERLLEVLRNAPTRTPPSVWQSPDADLGHLVVLTPRLEVWREFLRAARRAEIGLRMEYTNPFDYSYLVDRQRTLRIACLAAFLDDEELYDVAASGQDGPHAAFTYAQISMRDHAARKLATLLGLERRGSPEWNDDQWASLRTEVRQSLQRAGIAPLQLPTADGR